MYVSYVTCFCCRIVFILGFCVLFLRILDIFDFLLILRISFLVPDCFSLELNHLYNIDNIIK